MEIWKYIEGYYGLYQVSNLGNVKSLKFGKEKILKPFKDKDKYLIVNLYKQGKKKMFKVHRLVGQSFIPNPNNLPELNHIDEDKTNNRVENLEFCDRGYNVNFGTRTEKTSKQVLCLETGVIYSSTREIQRELGFSQSYISSTCNGKYKQAYGFHWKYVS